MTASNATDYAFSEDDVRDLMGLVQFSHDIRLDVLIAIKDRKGIDALLELFSQFIGLANSVIANNCEVAELVLITEGGMQPHEASKINLPTVFGALNGVLLTEGIDQAKTCGGCAFRLGTCANQSASTTCDADWCSDGEDQFMCHEDIDDAGKPTRKCTGFTQARRNRSKAGSV